MKEARVMQYRQVAVIGGKGAGPGQFSASLRGIALDAHANLYAANDAQITVFDAAGRLRRRWSTSQPVHSVAVAGDGAVYTGQIRQIEIFDGAGKLVHTWRDDALLGRVTAIGFVGGDVLAGDATGRAIRLLAPPGKSRNNTGRDTPLNGLLIPNGVVAELA